MGANFWAYLWMGILNVTAIGAFIYYKVQEHKEKHDKE